MFVIVVSIENIVKKGKRIRYVEKIRNTKNQSWKDTDETRFLDKARTWRHKKTAVNMASRLGSFMDNKTYKVKHIDDCKKEIKL